MTHLITNQQEAKRFNNLLDSYWIDSNSSSYKTEDIYNYYQYDENLPYIDTVSNNQKALALCLSSNIENFSYLLLSSKKIKNKKYSLSIIADTLNSNSMIDCENVILLIDCFKNTPEIFELFKTKIKHKFIESCINYFTKNTFFLEKDTPYFLSFLKEYKINPYDNKFNILDSLFINEKFETIDLLINKAKEIKDKEKIIYHNTDFSLSSKTMDYLSFKTKEHETLKSYQELDAKMTKNYSIAKKLKI